MFSFPIIALLLRTRNPVLNFIKYFLLCVLPLFYGNSFADPLDSFINSFEEQEVSLQWVKKNSHYKISDEQAKKIVRNSYAQSFSKKLNPHMVLSMIKNESGFRQSVRSSEGALGLMQVIPKWHKDKLKGRNPTDIKVSIEVGTTILSDCLIKHKNNHLKSLNCYSGGGGQSYLQKIKRSQNDLGLFVKNMNTSNLLMASL